MRPNPTPTRAPDGSGGSGQDPQRFAGIRRDYTQEDVVRLSGTFRIRHTLAEMGAARLWHLLKTQPFVPTLGALTGNQRIQAAVFMIYHHEIKELYDILPNFFGSSHAAGIA